MSVSSMGTRERPKLSREGEKSWEREMLSFIAKYCENIGTVLKIPSKCNITLYKFNTISFPY